MGRFQAMNGLAQMQKLVTWLRSANGVLILDNLESVTGEPLAIPNTLNSTEQEKLRDFLSRLVGGKTRVLLGSRSEEGWLGLVIRGNVYGLRGLDPEARTDLAKEILARHARSRAEDLLKDGDFGRLLKVLAGYPLAMEVVLPNLSRQSPGEVLTALQAADVDLDTGSEDRTRSILKCVEYSHSNLSQEAQRLLLCLAPFSGFILREGIPSYAEELRKLEPFQDYNFSLFDGAIQEAIHWGLLEPMDEEQQFLTIQPIFPYFLKMKLNELNEAIREALQVGFKNHYQGLADSYDRLMKSKDPQEKQLGISFCQLEYENLYNALQTCLSNQESINIFFCLAEYLKVINDIQGRLKLSKFVCQAQESYPTEIRTGEIGLEIVMALDRLANCYLQNQEHQESRKIRQAIVLLYQKLTGIKEIKLKYALASNYHQLGLLAQELREFEEARQNYKQALAIKIQYDFRQKQAITYHQLGVLAQDLREFEEARQNYQQALTIFVEFKDNYHKAVTFVQLGLISWALKEFEEARKIYQQALAIFVKYGDRHFQASTYNNLGLVAQDLRECEEARENYQQALTIWIEDNDRYNQAHTYHNLGNVAYLLENYKEARQNYEQALAIFVEYANPYEFAPTYFQLGKVFKDLKKYKDAKQNYQLALAIYIEFNNRYEQARTYHELGRIAHDLMEYEEAGEFYQQALSIYFDCGEVYEQASIYNNLGNILEELGQLQEAKTNFLQALSIWAEFNDQYSLETFSIPALNRLYQTTQDPSILETIAQLFGTTVEEVLAALGTG
jgi:tetratricopeptide (TPR) repeat protein